MGACTFFVKGRGLSAKDAFQDLVEAAQYDHGHSGYTGTIAEKLSFVMINLPEGREPGDYADDLIDRQDARINDKWGPAGCFDLGGGEYYFFGWASE